MPTKNGKRKNNEKQIEDYEDIINQNGKRKNELKYNLDIKCKNEKQKHLLNLIKDPEVRIIFIKGSAGTGKTFVSLLGSLFCLKNEEYNINKILMSKVIVPAARDIGYLKGELDDKIAPYFKAYWNNIEKMVGKVWSDYLKENSFIEETLVNFVRGDTFGNFDSKGNPVGEIAILDEAQNSTVTETKTFLSRLAEQSKMIIMGDTDQVDIKLKRNEKTGLDDAFDRFQGINGIEFIEFTDDDIVRDPFLIEVMKRYDDSKK